MKSLKCVIIIVSFATILITTMPIVILSYTLLPYDIINYSKQYYSYEDSSFIEKLNIDIDIGNVSIRYVPQPVDFAVQIDLKFIMGGIGLKDKLFANFFEVEWQGESNTLNFTMHIKDGSELERVLSQIRKFDILISLKADIVCDISVLIKSGNVALKGTYGITVGSIFANLSKGDIDYQFSDNQIDGNITGIVKEGDISFNTKRVQYTKNYVLTFINDKGYSLIQIFQDCEIGSNITGIATTITGIIELIYEDDSQNIGAQFILNNKRDFGNQANNIAIGFENDELPSFAGQKFYSYDFPAQNHYNFSLYKPYSTDMGDFIWDLYSVPTSKS